MTDQIKDTTMNKLSLQYGLLMGAISVILAVVFRIIDPVFQFTNWWVSILILILTIVLLVILAIDIRKKTGGYWSFGAAFKCLMIIGLFATIISTTYNFVVFKFVDPAMPEKVNSAMMAKTSEMLEKFGVEQSKIDESTKQFTNGEFKATMQPTLVNELKAILYGLIFYAIIGLIIAACVKKKAPVYLQSDGYADPAVCCINSPLKQNRRR
jgi:hypothetical protein